MNPKEEQYLSGNIQYRVPTRKIFECFLILKKRCTFPQYSLTLAVGANVDDLKGDDVLVANTILLTFRSSPACIAHGA